ncbi:MAG: sec-independent translocation protein [Actinoallomurus sp.]|nr:sec-independent translocation protein [Actinoallomurus sp.]
MFDVGLGEALVLVVLALIIFGPDQLPKVASQAGRALRQLRTMANSAKQDLQEGLGPEFADFDVADLSPRRFVRKHLLEDLDDLHNESAVTEEPLLPFGQRPPYDYEAT